MTRYFTRVTAVWASASPTSNALDVPFGHMGAAAIHISGAWTNSHIGLQQYVFSQWQPCRDEQAGFTGVSLPSASGNCSHQGPLNWFNFAGSDGEFKLWSHDGTGSGVAQAAARTVVVDFKS